MKLHFTSIRLAACLIPAMLFGFYVDTGWHIPLILSFISIIILGMLHYKTRISMCVFRAFPLRLQRSGRAIRYIFSCQKQQKDEACPEQSRRADIPNANTYSASERWLPLRQTLFGTFVFTAVFLIGWLSVSLHQHKNQPYHYTNHININTKNSITFKIRKILKPTAFYNRCEIKIISINNKKASGTVLLNIKKDSSFLPLKIDDRYVVKTQLKKVLPPLNPHQFSYKNYLEKQHIYHQLYVGPKALYQLPDATMSSVYGMASSLRKKINRALKKQGFKDDELAVINALLLGQRQDISKEVYNSYARAGAIHILAVSGLHVGIILLIFNFLLMPLERLKHGKKLKLLLIVLLLWAFALIAGLSASVVRAVTMFSFVAWAMHLKRSTNIYNILAVSMCSLLLIKPSFLFDVGFQLSYSAVFAIVWLQPLLYNRWKPAYKVPDFFWKILTVTLAAQCGVAPLSLYYFHQFPGLFFVSNLVIIPVLGLILGFGILIIVLALLHKLPLFLAAAYESVIGLMNSFISWVAQQEAFLFKDIPFDGKLLLTVYLVLISGILAFKKPVFRRIVFFLAAILMLQGVFIFNRYNTENTNRFIVFHNSRNTLIGEQKGIAIKLYLSDEKLLLNDRMIKNYKVAERIKFLEKEDLKNIYVINEKLLLRVDSLGIYNVPELQPDYILLCDSPKINLERLITELKPTAILADGSNYKSDIQRWKATCEAKKIPFHATAEKGAFIIVE